MEPRFRGSASLVEAVRGSIPTPPLCRASVRRHPAPPAPGSSVFWPLQCVPAGLHGGQRSKGEAEPDGATFSWLRLPSGSRPRLHPHASTLSRLRPPASRPASAWLQCVSAGRLELLLESCQTGPNFIRFYSLGNTIYISFMTFPHSLHN
jgi:hypothetical protein